jgi:hypothetical protein
VSRFLSALHLTHEKELGGLMLRLIGQIGVMLLFVGASAVAAAQSQGATRLTNDDIVKMVRAKLSTGVIVTTVQSANFDFDLSPAGLIALKQAGVEDQIIEAMQARARARERGSTTDASTRVAPEKSELLASSKDRDEILRGFKTVLVDARQAKYFSSAQLKAALGSNRDFAALRITIVDDGAVADAVLEVGYQFAWDFPFSLKHQNTSVVLVSGKGTGPFSGPRGATSVAAELVKVLKPYRETAPPPKR